MNKIAFPLTAACPVAELRRQAYLALDVEAAARQKLAAGPSSSDGSYEAEILDAEDRREFMEEAASHYVASSAEGREFQMAELECAMLNLHQSGVEFREHEPLARKVLRLISVVSRGVKAEAMARAGAS
jgi:hypothetical protein